MSNYHVEPADQSARPDEGGDQVAAQGAGPGPVPPPADARRAGGGRRALHARGAGRHGSRSPGRACAAGSAASSRSARSTTSRPRTTRCRSPTGSRRTSRRRARSSSSSTRPSSGSIAGEDTTGDGTALNVRALYQRCPHLGCKPNPCLSNFWMECPCHGSRYDRLGIKADGAQYGPAPRSMDRFSITVDSGWRAVRRYRQDHAGPTPGRARAAGHHPAAYADRVHLSGMP